VSVTALFVLTNMRQPLGFQIDDVWVLTVDPKASGDPATLKVRQRDTWSQVIASLTAQPQVIAAGTCFAAPYVPWSWESDFRLKDGRHLLYATNRVSDGFGQAVHPTVVSGRWFSPDDDGVAWDAVVMNTELARQVFGSANPVGQVVPENDPGEVVDETRPRPLPKRVVGVIEAFRQHGDYSAAGPYMFSRNSTAGDVSRFDLPRMAVLRVRPGTTAAFEETVIRELERVAPEWSFSLQSNDAIRESTNRMYLLPLLIFGTVAAFLLLMVALGLSGVLWQMVTQRTSEFGVRRAQGATASSIGRQVLLELLLLTTLAMIPGLILLAQMPLLPLPRDLRIIEPPIFIAGVAMAAVLLYSVTLASAFYPSRLATRIAPAEALRAE
jgi:putative ABC transport system permease protein